MPDEIATRVFERFFRADPSRSRKHGGTGLGLSIVAAVIKAHHGEIECRSALGAGTTFVITLPAASTAGTVVRGHGSRATKIEAGTSADGNTSAET